MTLKTFLSVTILGMALSVSAALCAVEKKHEDFTVGKGTFMLGDKPFVVKAAEVHYPRIPRPYWNHRIKMCKALGMNTLCLYVFWNIHEQSEGVFNFTDNNDVAAFCRLAQDNGMYVIVRPGPYVCAEWEMGGLPWWLLKKKDIQLRSRDTYFMERVKIFEEKVAEQLAPLTIQNGGPIIMVQVENEYGSYGEDKAYVGEIRDILRKLWCKKGLGDKENGPVLFQCDWSSNFTLNGLDDLVWTMNFGTGANINEQFRRLGELRPDAPKMCSEFWSGWFDKWGARHETRPAKDMVEGIDEMLSKGISFSLYMTHGGTSFGHWAGANSPGFAPDVTSYDYDAPVNEYGHPTSKFYEMREMMKKYADGKKLPSVPKSPMPIVSVPEFRLDEFAPLTKGIDNVSKDGGTIKTFEDLDMGWGSVLYECTLPELAHESTLHADIHDFGQVFIDNNYIGKIDRVKNEKSLVLPPAKAGAKLWILVEGMGRINFGRAVKDYKGIVGDVTISTETEMSDITVKPKVWTCHTIPDHYATVVKAFEKVKEETPVLPDLGKRGYYRGYFTLKKVGDTFLNFETWGKGQVYVNGYAVGRIWSIGPQQTLYVPGCWLKKGENEVVVLDVVGPRKTSVCGLSKPVLDKLQLESDGRHNNIGDKPDLNSMAPVASGTFRKDGGWQKVEFARAAKGRYLALECLGTYAESEVVSIAEIYVRAADGKRLSRESWQTKYADSEDMNGNHTGDKVFDLQESTYWQTAGGTELPHLLVIDLGAEQTLTALEYLPRADQGTPGAVKGFKVYVY